MWTRTVTLVNARVVTPHGLARSIRFADRVLAIGEEAGRGDAVVDVEGAFVLPGLVNAHDHLELNHYGALKGRDTYQNASEWIADVQPRLTLDPAVLRARAQPLGARLFIGALKNVLAGTTTVAHHNPLYREIGRGFPVRVVRRYGWAHSFDLQARPAGANGEPGGDVRQRHRTTPADAPFIVHIGEGLDERAAAELPRLEAIGALDANTVVVHGVALDERDWRDVMRRHAGLVWCPASNRFLFGRTAAVGAFIHARGLDGGSRVALGTDSRLTGSRDLLDELRAASGAGSLTAAELLRMVTTAPADLLRVRDVGRLQVGVPADLLLIKGAHGGAAAALLETRRADVQLVTLDGHPMVGAPALAAVFRARSAGWRPILVDGTPHLADAALARAIERCPIAETGVECA